MTTKAFFESYFKELSKTIVGQEAMLKYMMIGIMTDSNVLMEGYPGLAKTRAIRSMAEAMELKFSRIQGTPDLMPSDITGTYLIEETKEGKRKFRFEPGPLFANIVLADEINRATPKTQSALLEAMQEKQVTVGNETFKLEAPFFILATQNPIEQEGSLVPEETVFFNGELITGTELLKKSANYPVIEKEGKKVYFTNGWTYSLDVDGKIKKKKCHVYEIPYDDKIYKIKLRTGRQISVSKNHPFLVFSEGELQWKKAENLSMKDSILCPALLPEDEIEMKRELTSHEEALKSLEKKYKVVRSEELLKLKEKTQDFTDLGMLSYAEMDMLRIGLQKSKKELAKELLLDSAEYWQLIRFFKGIFKGRNSAISNIRLKLENYIKEKANQIDLKKDYIESYKITSMNKIDSDEDLAGFLGCLLSDGAVMKNSIFFSQKNMMGAFDFFKSFLEKNGLKYNIRHREKENFEIVVRSKPFREYLKIRYGLEGKDIPSWMVSLPKEMRKQFLKNFNSLEGNIENNRITITQKSRNSINVLSYMLLKEGIIHKIIDETRIMRIRIQGDSERYMANIGWLTDKKVGKNTQNKYRTLPVRNDLKIMASKMKLQTSHEAYNAVRSVNSGREWITPESYRQIAGAAQELMFENFETVSKSVSQWIKGEVIYDHIESITAMDHKGSVFGLTVPGVQNYIAGLGGCGINHNTYPLPEAQADRFLLKITVDYPNLEEEIAIVDMITEGGRSDKIKPLMNAKRVIEMQETTYKVPIANDIKRYAVSLVSSTRKNKELIEFGASPRASIGLILAAKANALIDGRKHVSKEDIKELALPILRHRIILSFEAQRQNMTTDDVIRSLLK